MTRRRLWLLALTVWLAGLAGWAPAAAQGARINLETLARHDAGWIELERTGDLLSGAAGAERSVWPVFHLHWKPLQKRESRLDPAEAAAAVGSLWPGTTIDSPLKAVPAVLPAAGGHDGYVFETTLNGGTIRARYFVWSCPESRRMILVDTKLSLEVNAPEVLMDWQRDMAHTVRCHPGVKVEEHPHLDRRYDVPDGAIAYSHPPLWRPVPGYRVQSGLTDYLFDPQHPPITPEAGQDMAVPADAMKRIYVSWRPREDAPMSYDVLKAATEEFWRLRAVNMIPLGNKYSNGVWMTDGVVDFGRDPARLPPSPRHKWRAWMWRTEKTTYFAVAQIGAIKVGRRFLTDTLGVEDWNNVLEAMFQSIVY